MEKHFIWAAIAFILIGAMIEDNNKKQLALSCIEKGMQWDHWYGGSCKSVEKK
jgi:hypothetical protein